jgi:hypothetical protein
LLAPTHLAWINENCLSSEKVKIPRLLMEPKIFLYIAGPIKEHDMHMIYFTGLKPVFYQKALTITIKFSLVIVT